VWRPKIEPEGLPFAPRAGDWYAVVDDLEVDLAVVVISPWPAVDELGHLVFEDEAVSRDARLDALQRAVDRRRKAAGQPAHDRAVRVGDVFWLRTPAREMETGDPGRWRILDVTRAARQAARAALLVAANPALRAVEPAPAAEPEESDETGGRPAPRTGAASAAV
jgi:hypothetical protein